MESQKDHFVSSNERSFKPPKTINSKRCLTVPDCILKELSIRRRENKELLKKGDYKNSVKEQPGSSAVVQGISSDEQGIGYSGIGYVTSGVKTLSLAEKSGKAAVQPSYDNCINGTYPLSRYLLIYVNKKPGEPLDTLTREFIKFIVSKDGQEIVTKDGYYPIPAKVSAEVLKSIE